MDTERMSWHDVKKVVTSPTTWWYQRGVSTYVDGHLVWLMRVTRAGWPLETVCINMSHCDPDHMIPLIEGEVGIMLRKRADRRVEGETQSGLKAGPFELAHKDLWAYLTDTAYEDGSPREPSSLLVFVQDGQLKGMLRDKAEGLCLWGTANSLADLLALLDVMVADPESVWRVDRQQPGQAAKRRPGGGRR